MKVVVQLALIEELRMFSAGGLEFNSHLEVCLCVDALVDLAESTLPYLLDYFEIFTHLLRQIRHIINFTLPPYRIITIISKTKI